MAAGAPFCASGSSGALSPLSSLSRRCQTCRSGSLWVCCLCNCAQHDGAGQASGGGGQSHGPTPHPARRSPGRSGPAAAAAPQWCWLLPPPPRTARSHRSLCDSSAGWGPFCTSPRSPALRGGTWGPAEPASAGEHRREGYVPGCLCRASLTPRVQHTSLQLSGRPPPPVLRACLGRQTPTRAALSRPGPRCLSPGLGHRPLTSCMWSAWRLISVEAYSDRIRLCSWASQALLPELALLASVLQPGHREGLGGRGGLLPRAEALAGPWAPAQPFSSRSGMCPCPAPLHCWATGCPTVPPHPLPAPVQKGPPLPRHVGFAQWGPAPTQAPPKGHRSQSRGLTASVRGCGSVPLQGVRSAPAPPPGAEQSLKEPALGAIPVLVICVTCSIAGEGSEQPSFPAPSGTHPQARGRGMDCRVCQQAAL